MTRPHPEIAERCARLTTLRDIPFPDTGRIGGFEASRPGPCRSRRQNVYSATQRQSAGRWLCFEDAREGGRSNPSSGSRR